VSLKTPELAKGHTQHMSGTSTSTSSPSISDDLRHSHSAVHPLKSSAAHNAMRRFRDSIAAENTNMPLDRVYNPVGSPPPENVQKGVDALEHWSKARTSHQQEHASDVPIPEHLFERQPSQHVSVAGISKAKASYSLSDDLKDLHSEIRKFKSSTVHDTMRRFHDGVAVEYTTMPLDSAHSLAHSPPPATVVKGKNVLARWSKDHTLEKHDAVQTLIVDAALRQPRPSSANLLSSKAIGVDLKSLMATERQLRQSDIHTAMHKLDVRAHEVVSHPQAKMPSADVVSKGEIALEHWSKAHLLA